MTVTYYTIKYGDSTIMQEKLTELEGELVDVVFLQETLCRAVFDDDDCMFLHPLSKIISERLENILKEIQDIVPET